MNNEKLQENFCPVCIATLPMAFSLVQGSNSLNTEDEETYEQQRKRKRNLNLYILIGIISTAVIFYYTVLAPCDKCKIKKLI